MKPLNELREELIQEMVRCLPELYREDAEAIQVVKDTVERVVRYHGKGFGRVPDEMWGGLLRWILFAIPAGDFLKNILKNNWMESFQHADERNTEAMAEWSMVVYNDVPLQCRGKHYHSWQGLIPRTVHQDTK